MKKLKIFQTVQWKVVIIYLLLILIAMQVISAYFIREMERFYVSNFSDTLHSHANLLAVNLERYLAASTQKAEEEGGTTDFRRDIDYLVNNLVSFQGAVVQVIDQNGIVISTNEEEKGIVGQKNTRTEVNMALLGTRNESIKLDPETTRRVKVLAVPVKKGGQVLGAIYMEASMEGMYEIMGELKSILATGTAIALLLTGTLGVALSRTITRPVVEITRQAAAMAEGDFNRQVHIYSEDEIGKLGQAFNYLTRRLKQALSQNEEERKKLSSVLSNMSDGVIATDRDGNIMLINQRARQLLNLNEDDERKTLGEVLPLSDEKRAWSPSFQGEGTLLIEVPGDEEAENEKSLVRVVFTTVQGKDGKGKGIIAVLQDVTEQEKLENERKEFVANVSHELRTPLTTMKSYLEALDEGALEDKEIAPRFVKVIMNETDRMIRLVHDLLQLSRLDSREARFVKKPVPIKKIVNQVVERFAMQSQQQGLHIEKILKDGDTRVFVDQDSIIQVLDNLLSNAVKYSNNKGNIRVRTVKMNRNWLKVEVEDEGVGIPRRDLSRIFERFYRVDKARSRKMGGTGLGLSIAREIVKQHGGNIQIDSKENKGTRVMFTLPVYRGNNDVE
ncbi:MAG: cell wall metabolism sensor histidine kinase WalK [Bacillaceae bacterium]|nr:cell wall metabolism sensor histidine kinase WalK [Bacillaceae bacterium]